MLIKQIIKDKKHLTRLCFCDGTEVLLDTELVLEQGLCTDTELSYEDLERLRLDSDYKRAKSRALWYLDRMDYTEKALYNKLLKAGFDKRACAMVLSKLCELELVSDIRYAERMAVRLNEANVSKREAVSKMLSRGVPLDLAKQVLEETDSDEQIKLAALLDGKYAYKLTLEDGPKKVFAALIRKGFSYSAVRAAMSKKIKELDFSEDC